ncbi:MAG: hypothetical protein WA116_00010, partial [Anaerolineaceae bacterium]
MNQTTGITGICLALMVLILGSCNTALPNTGGNAAPTATEIGHSTTLPTPGVDSISTLPPDESTVELPVETPQISNQCQSTVHVTPENNADNPITEETRIMEILTGLSELELCNFPAKEGWLHRYDVINGKPGGHEFLAHLPGGSPSCDLQLWVENENGKYLPRRLGDLRDSLQVGGYFVELDEDGNLVRSERGPIQCDLRNGASSVGTGTTPYFIAGAVAEYEHRYYLQKTNPESPNIKGWFSNESGKSEFVIERYGQDRSGT